MSSLERIRQMTPADLAALGLQWVAYVKPVEYEGEKAYAIHAADGTQMAVVKSRDAAFATIKQNDLEPVSVH